MDWKQRFANVFRRDDPEGADRRRIRKHRGGYQSMLDREATPADLNDLRAFTRAHSGVEFYVEPETTATDTTAVAVASDGAWTRRRVGSPAVARKLASELGIPAYDVTVVGYPAAMRRHRRRDPSA
ncbi:MAG: oxidoreductase [Sciscionella sp.]